MAKSKKMAEVNLLDSAWNIAFNSKSFEVIGLETDNPTFLNNANLKLHNISKSEWFPEARLILAEKDYLDKMELAELAACRWINKIMGTSHLKVSFGGDT